MEFKIGQKYLLTLGHAPDAYRLEDHEPKDTSTIEIELRNEDEYTIRFIGTFNEKDDFILHPDRVSDLLKGIGEDLHTFRIKPLK